MAISLFDLLKVGIGPSSSHTVGPMKAAQRYVRELEAQGRLCDVNNIRIQLFGSLGATGLGHGTDTAVLMGLEGCEPETVEPTTIAPRCRAIAAEGLILLGGNHRVSFAIDDGLIYHRQESLPYHPNGMMIETWDKGGDLINQREYYSIGGGFVVDGEEAKLDHILQDNTPQPYAFSSGEELLAICRQTKLSIAEIMLANEMVWRSEEDVRSGILAIWATMQQCVKNGISQHGILPGGLRVKRRAAALYDELKKRSRMDMITPSLGALDWVNLYALAVNEENAAGGRIVTAPTNGAAGIMPAVLHYYKNFCPNADEDGVVDFILTASAIGLLFKKNASISGAEVGCQGEVGSACAMAAAGLAQATGATPEQVENAAEIGMEHNLGLTCDPIGGLVQIPCIERNAMASIKAINAASLALRGDGKHFVSLDKVIQTMRETGRDMLDKYKETSRGGLAVNVIEC